MPASESDARSPDGIFVCYDEWLAVYEKVKAFGEWGDVIAFLELHPATINNRKGGLDGCTFLHQAVWWGCDRGIITTLRDFGANPHLQNGKKKTPADMSRSSREAAAALIDAVYGEDDARKRVALLHAARLGQYGEMMEILRERPYLVNTQGHRGWAVIHQVAFHGVTESLLRALVDLGASLVLRTYEGETAEDILRRTFPDSKVSMAPGATIPTIAVGRAVTIHPRLGEVSIGIVLSINNKKRTVQVKTSAENIWVPRCRVTPLPGVPSEGTLANALANVCIVCFDTPVPPGWKISPNCTSFDHPNCADCMAKYLWSEYTHYGLPFKCKYCKCDLSLDLHPWVRRAMIVAWPPGSREGQALTGLSFWEFADNVRLRLAELQQKGEQGRQLDELSRRLRMLEHSQLGKVEGVSVEVPLTRGCPRCFVIIEYDGNCQWMDCPECSYNFCWVCLRSKSHHSDAQFDGVAVCTVADIQSQIPIMRLQKFAIEDSHSFLLCFDDAPQFYAIPCTSSCSRLNPTHLLSAL
eukprot:EG_transcript_8179